MLYADHERRHRRGRAGPGAGHQLGATDVLSDALNTQAASSGRTGPGLGRPDAPRPGGLALAGGYHDQAARAYTNLSGIHADRRQFAEAAGVPDRRRSPSATSTTSPRTRICLRDEQSDLLERTGRWAEAVELAAELLRKATRSPANRLCALIRLAAISARRGEPEVWAYLDQAVPMAYANGEPQQRVPVRLGRAEAHWLEGEPDRRAPARGRAGRRRVRDPQRLASAGGSRPGCAAPGFPRPTGER